MQSADAILARDARMKSDKASYDSLCQEVAELMLPRQADFLGATGNGFFPQTRERSRNIFDDTATQSLDHGVTVFEGEVIPPGSQWQVLQPRDDSLMKSQRVRLWYELKTNQLFALRNSADSGWGNQTHESVASLLAFGTQATWSELRRDPSGKPLGIGYQSRHVGEIRIAENAWGFVDTVHREFTLTHRQAYQKWREQSPPCVLKAITEPGQKRIDDRSAYLHVLEPNKDYEPGRIDSAGMLVSSCYVSVADKMVFDTGGFRSMPLIVSRYEKSPTEIYGRGPAFNVLPSVRACQEMSADLITAIEFMARPSLGAHDDIMDQVLNYSPGGVTYGAIDDRGNAMIKRLFDNPEIGPALQLLQETRGAIQRAFFEDLYSIRQEQKTHVTAADTMDRMQQRGLMLAPLQRQETEWFTPMAARELDLMEQMGLVDDMPPEVKEAGGLYQVSYQNPLSRARMADGASGFYQMLNAVAPLMNLDQTNIAVFERIYPFAKVLAFLGKVHAVPAICESTDAEKAAFDEKVAIAGNKSDVLETGDRAANIAKTLAEASAAGGRQQVGA